MTTQTQYTINELKSVIDILDISGANTKKQAKEKLEKLVEYLDSSRIIEKHIIIKQDSKDLTEENNNLLVRACKLLDRASKLINRKNDIETVVNKVAKEYDMKVTYSAEVWEHNVYQEFITIQDKETYTKICVTMDSTDYILEEFNNYLFYKANKQQLSEDLINFITKHWVK